MKLTFKLYDINLTIATIKSFFQRAHGISTYVVVGTQFSLILSKFTIFATIVGTFRKRK